MSDQPPPSATKDVPEVFTRGVEKIMDTSLPKAEPPKAEPAKEDLGVPTHEMRPPSPGGNSVVNSNQHARHTVTPTYTPPKETAKMPTEEVAKDVSGQENGYASRSFRDAQERGRER